MLKLYARFALQIYCRKIVLNKQDFLHANGPLLFAANHPNSFLDGMILTTLLQNPVWSLARGDAFKNKYAAKLLRRLHLLPVYRTSEGVENLSHNYTTFEACKQVFNRTGIVLIFSEGRCENEWHLRPLKKGTARLAISSWQQGLPLTVVPLGFNYSSFRSFGKVVHLNFGTPLQVKNVLLHKTDGKQMAQFNEQLHSQLSRLVYEVREGDKPALRTYFSTKNHFIKTALLALPALAGLVLHAPLYMLAKKITDHYFNNGHYDSVITSLLMIGYLLYWPLIIMLSGYFFGLQAALCTLVFMPFTAWAFVQVKYDATY